MDGPAQIQPQTPGDYLGVMSKAVFQAGISWRVVETKWPGINEAFRGFDPRVLVALTADDVEALEKDPKVIRKRSKIEATIENARQMLDLEQQHGSFKAYRGSHGSFEATVKDLRKRFKFLGDTGAYYFLHVVGEPVPSHEEWMASRATTAK